MGGFVVTLGLSGAATVVYSHGFLLVCFMLNLICHLKEIILSKMREVLSIVFFFNGSKLYHMNLTLRHNFVLHDVLMKVYG